MQRIPVLERDELDEAQRAAYDAIASGPRGVVQGPLNVWLNSAALAQHAQALGAFCRYGTSLPPRLSELAILVTAVHWQAGFEWYAHAGLGLKAGLDPAQVEVLRTGGTPDFAAEDERLVHELATELLRTRDVSAATYARGEAMLGRQALVELIGILGYYQLISMTIKAFRVAVPPGEAEPFGPGADG
jgi:4-carboxymuconolactone decarboxylase